AAPLRSRLSAETAAPPAPPEAEPINAPVEPPICWPMAAPTTPPKAEPTATRVLLSACAVPIISAELASTVLNKILLIFMVTLQRAHSICLDFNVEKL